MPIPEMDAATRTELEAAAFRRLVAHLQERTDVQNIDLMTLSGFCRNCLSRWYREAAGDRGLPNGKPVDEWGIRVAADKCTPVGAAVGLASVLVAGFSIRKAMRKRK